MVRITGGEFRGRSLVTPKGMHTRPSHAQLRQAIFNSLQAEVPGAKCLDLFAGAGSLAFEALSRGAESVVVVENHRDALAAIRENAKTLDCASQLKLVDRNVTQAWTHLTKLGPFDLIFADPPFHQGWAKRVLELGLWDILLTAHGVLVMQWFEKGETLPDEVAGLVKVREKTYGDNWLTHYRRSS
jgi:16S rRNA (guanine966-N2)-methyltransferase